MIKNYGHPLYPHFGLDEKAQNALRYEVNKTILTLHMISTEVDDYPNEVFVDALKLISAHDLKVSWTSHLAERSRDIRKTLYSMAKDSLCIYTQAVDGDLIDSLANPMAKNVPIHVLSDERPGNDGTPAAALINHIIHKGHGSLTHATANSRGVISDMFGNHTNPHFVLADNKRHIVDRHRDGHHLVVGFEMRKSFLAPRTQAFARATAVGEPIAGQPPKCKKNIWSFLR